VVGQLAEIVVEQAGDGVAILQSCVTQIHNWPHLLAARFASG
jgi:hypothetical protein